MSVPQILMSLRSTQTKSLGTRVRCAVASAWSRPTLRIKGLVMLVALALYLLLVIFALNFGRELLSHVSFKFRQVHVQEETLASLSTSLASAMIDPDLGPHLNGSSEFIDELTLHIQTAISAAPVLKDVYPALVLDLQDLAGDVQAINHQRSFSSAEVNSIRSKMYRIAVRLGDAAHDVRERRTSTAEEYRRLNDRMALIVVTAGLLGLSVFAVMITVFLGRLGSDVRQVEQRALDVALGYRGPPLAVTRHDEVGGMMAAVNRMQLELREREKQLEVSRQQRFHQEKMAAVGSLAAAVAHEINNPIEAISGMAQYMAQAQKTAHCPSLCQPQLILEQAQRIASITRNIAQVTAPRSPQPQLLDLNAVVRNTCDFVSYDKRFAGVDLTLDLAHDLRAIKAVPDHITQILMNVLINAANALADVKDRKPAIRVATRVAGGEVVATVGDNGHGMTPDVLSQAFQEYFTTKPEESGGGLGLFLCKALIEQNGGRIEIESQQDVGTTVSLHMPLPSQRPAQA